LLWCVLLCRDAGRPRWGLRPAVVCRRVTTRLEIQRSLCVRVRLRGSLHPRRESHRRRDQSRMTTLHRCRRVAGPSIRNNPCDYLTMRARSARLSLWSIVTNSAACFAHMGSSLRSMVTAVLPQTMQSGASSVVASDCSVMVWISASRAQFSMTVVPSAAELDTLAFIAPHPAESVTPDGSFRV
jgi:hypothetical protein